MHVEYIFDNSSSSIRSFILALPKKEYILGSFIDERKYLESDPKKSFIYELQFGISRHVSDNDKDMCIIISLFDSNDIKSMWQNAWFLVNKIFLNKKLKWIFSDTHIKYYINLNSSKL